MRQGLFNWKRKNTYTSIFLRLVHNHRDQGKGVEERRGNFFFLRRSVWGWDFIVCFFFFFVSFGSRTCSLVSLMCTTLQEFPFLEVINATSPNLKSDFCLWDLVKGKYMIFVCMVCFLCFFLKPRLIFVCEALYKALQVTLT